MGHSQHDLSLVVKAVDHASGPFAKIKASLREMNIIDAESGKHHHKPSVLGAFKEIGAAGKELGKEVLELGAKLGELLAIGGGVAFVELIHGSIEAGAQLSKMSRQIGMSATYYAGLSYAAKKAQVSQEEFDESMSRFNKNLGDAKGGQGKLLAFLQKVSPVLAHQIKRAKSTGEAFTLMRKAIAAIPDPMRRAALTGAAFGKGSVQLMALLAQSDAQLGKTLGKYHELAGGQNEFAEGSEEVESTLIDVKTSFEGITHAASTQLYPALIEIAEAVTEFFVEHREDIKKWAEEAKESIKEWVHEGGLKRVAEGFAKIASAVGWAFEKLGPMGVAIAASAPLWIPLASGVMEVAEAFGALLAAVGLPLAPVLLLSAAVVAMWANWDSIKDLPILSEIDKLIKGVSDLTDAWRALKDETVTPLSGREDVEKDAQKNALQTVANGALELGAFAVAPGVQLKRWADKAGWSGEPRNAGPGSAESKSKVTVDFKNMPHGARVEHGKHEGPTEVEINTHPSMETP